jgi:hypothetical protein
MAFLKIIRFLQTVNVKDISNIPILGGKNSVHNTRLQMHLLSTMHSWFYMPNEPLFVLTVDSCGNFELGI